MTHSATRHTHHSIAMHAGAQEFLGYWRTSYDWRRWEAELNRLPQFITTIQGPQGQSNQCGVKCPPGLLHVLCMPVQAAGEVL